MENSHSNEDSTSTLVEERVPVEAPKSQKTAPQRIKKLERTVKFWSLLIDLKRDGHFVMCKVEGAHSWTLQRNRETEKYFNFDSMSRDNTFTRGDKGTFTLTGMDCSQLTDQLYVHHRLLEPVTS